MIAVTFDYGQTLGELDTSFLASRLGERGALAASAALDLGMPSAWAEYDDAKRRGESGHEAWTSFMRALLTSGKVQASEAEGIPALAEFLWTEQPRRNLWRRPIAGMKELVEELSARRVPLGIVSNSEGKLAILLEEMGLRGYFRVVADSGVLGFEKPDPRIFDFAAVGLGVAPEDLIHVGDAWVADIEGARAVGARALFITRDEVVRALPAGVVACRDARDVRAALSAWGVP